MERIKDWAQQNSKKRNQDVSNKEFKHSIFYHKCELNPVILNPNNQMAKLSSCFVSFSNNEFISKRSFLSECFPCFCSCHFFCLLANMLLMFLLIWMLMFFIVFCNLFSPFFVCDQFKLDSKVHENHNNWSDNLDNSKYENCPITCFCYEWVIKHSSIISIIKMPLVPK